MTSIFSDGGRRTKEHLVLHVLILASTEHKDQMMLAAVE